MDQSDTQAPRLNPNVDFPYEYLPQGQIRLLTIHSVKDKALELSLEHHPYNTDLKYDALSYAWNPGDGARMPPVQIRCDDVSFHVSSDLSQAITQLGALKASRLWVDYICIDQSNQKEKDWQLPLMGQYYSWAKMVWIWLGPSHGHSDLAMQRIGEFASKLPMLNIANPVTNEWLNENELPEKHNDLWEGIDYLFTREWFNRLWTLQEFALASQSTFICGRRIATGPQFVSVAIEFRRLGLVSLSRGGRIPRVGFKDGYHFPTLASRYWEAKNETGGIALHLAVQLGRFKEAKGSNAHDRIYGLLGLLDPGVVKQITVNYDLPWWDVYVDVGKVSLMTSSHLEWLAQCQSSWRPKGLLPSWCGNLMAENEAAPFSYECYFAGFIWKEPSTPHFEFPAGTNNHLLIKGASFAKIESVAKFSEKWDVEAGPLDGGPAKFQYTLRWMTECLAMARTIPGMSSSAIPEAFLRTLVADVLTGGSTGHSDEQLKDMWACAYLLISRIISNDDTLFLDTRTQNSAHTFLDSVFHACRFRRFFITRDQSTTEQRLALGPDQVQVGDHVLVIKDACMPFVLRKNEKADVYRMLGPAYVRGRMMGQIPKLVAEGKLHWESFEIA